MSHMKKILMMMTAALALFAACDSIEDTYKDYTGDGPIRYPGKCTNVTVSPGWECLRVNWTLSNDPAVEHIVVTCASESDTLRQTLDAKATNCTIENLQNDNYTVSVQSQASDGMLSIAEGKTDRPYTYEHEAVRAYTRGYAKAFLAKGHLLLVMSGWDEGIERFWVACTSTDGQSKEIDLTQDMFTEKYVDLSGIDTSKPVVLHRKAKIAGCPDIIDFQPITITRNVVLNSDFQRNMTQRYGITSDEADQFTSTTAEVEIDHNLLSLEDLLFFTHLKKVVMGKNHYFDGKHYVKPTLEDTKTSKWVLEKLNEIYGTTVEQYGDSYLTWTASYIDKQPYSVLPELTYLNANGWTIENSEDDTMNEYLDRLLDNDGTTTWSSWPSTEGIRTMTLTIDMLKAQQVRGVKILQAANTETANYQPGNISIEYSADYQTWHNLGHAYTNTVGTAQGEATLIKAAQAVNARFLRVSFQEISYKGQVKVSLADIAVY